MSSDGGPTALPVAVVDEKKPFEETAEELKTDYRIEKGDESVTAVSGFDDMKLKYIESQSEKKSLQDKLYEAELKLKSLEEALEPAVEEFDHLKKKFDIEKCCRSEAEKYASKLQKENKTLKRQSQMLLLRLQPSTYADDLTDLKEDVEGEHDDVEPTATDDNDAAAQAEEERTKEPEDSTERNRTIERVLNERKCNGNVSELKETLKSMDIEAQQKSIEDLESQLQMAVEGSERLHQTTQEMETKIAQLEEENEILRGKLQICEERLRPPSPSSPTPPQTTSRFSPLRLFTKKNKKKGQVKEEATRYKTHDEAIKEMMDRIKSGQALKAAKKNTDEVVDCKQSVAMEELQRMLTSLKSTKERKLSPEEEEGEEEEEKNPPYKKNIEQQKTSKRQLRRLQRVATADVVSSCQ